MANSKRTAVTFRAQADTSKVRTETFGGREFTVVPVVALVEGVIQSMNSTKPELALASEFGRFAQGWNGRPLVMGHPQIDGVPVSANSPEILEEYHFGNLFNTRVVDKKLITEAWVDNARAEELGDATKQVLEDLQAGEVIEVSTGLWTEVAESSGFHGQARYEGVWKGIVPDHLAILPKGVIGACSVEGGCGTNRANAASSTSDGHAVAAVLPSGDPAPANIGNDGLQFRGNGGAWRTYSEKGDCGCGCGCGGSCGGHDMPEGSKPTTNQTPDAGFLANLFSLFSGKTITPEEIERANHKPTYDPARVLDSLMVQEAPANMLSSDISKLLSAAVQKAKSPDGYCYVMGFTRDKVIYEEYGYGTGYATYQRSYTVSADGSSVTLGDDAERVNLITQIVVANAEGSPLNANASPEAEGETTMAGENKPGAGTAPTNAPTTPAAGETGGTPTNPPAATGTQETTAAPVANATPAPAPAPAPTPPAAPPTFEQLLANADPATREAIQQGVRMANARKAELIGGLKASGRCKFDDAYLNAQSIQTLEAMAELASVPNYGGVASPTPVHANAGGNRANEGPPPAPVAFPVVQPGASKAA